LSGALVDESDAESRVPLRGDEPVASEDAGEWDQRVQERPLCVEVQPDIDFRVTVTGRQKQLAREIQHEIYRIGREALVNAFCHSGANASS
jgi:signal transduction histidine kinase